MANEISRTYQYGNTIPPSDKIPSTSAPSFATRNAISNVAAHSSGAVKKRFFFSTSNIRFWTIGRSGKKTTKQKSTNSAAEVMNYGDQLRYIKEERHTMRRRLYECSLRSSEHNLHFMRTNNDASNHQKHQQQHTEIRRTSIQRRQLSEPNVNMVNDRMSHERYLTFMEKPNDRFLHSTDNIDNNDEQDSRNNWEEWMRNQPISVLRLDRTERLVLRIGDERDAIQKKTFTKWVNKHLGKAGLHVEDLFVDLTDGYNLIALLEALSAEKMPRENGYTRFHRIQNVQYCLDFLRKKNIRTVNIRPEDIVEGNPKLTLGLIWTIILNFQVSVIKQRQQEASSGNQVSEVLASTDGVSARDALLQWAQDVTRGYPGVNVRNFTSSWRDGLAFNAILHRYRPNLIQWSKISDESVSARDRLNNAFAAAESEFGVSRLLDAEDVDVDAPDEKSIITYVSSLYNALPHSSELNKYEDEMYEYEREAAEWLHWVERATRMMDDRQLPTNLGELRRLEHDLERFKLEELPSKAREKQRLANQYAELHHLYERTEHLRIPGELTTRGLDRAWQRLLRSLNERFSLIEERAGVQGTTTDIISRLARGIGITNEKLDHILKRIEDAEIRVDTSRPSELQRLIDGIIDDLMALEVPIHGFFEDVDQLKRMRHPEANDYYQQVYGLEQRRQAYLSRLRTQFMARLGIRTEQLMRESEQRRETIRRTTFVRVEECVQWTRSRLEKLSEMEFVEDLEQLESMFEEHKIDNHEIQDFRQNVDECIARQAEILAEDTHEYCELLSTLESEYQQLRDLSAGRMLDLDTLIAFIRGAQQEIVWINEREDIEVSRNWSDINQLDLPMLQNYYKQLLHEIELREPRFNDVHNKGAALLNQGHPAIHVIEFYLNAMQRKWDWLLALSKCLEQHLRDALSLNSFIEDANAAEEWMAKQSEMLERKYNRGEFTLEEGEQMLRELDEINELIKKYHSILMTLTERSSKISPLWQRGERIQRSIPVIALADYIDRNITIREGDECILIDNSDLIHWIIRGPDGVEASVPSVLFRIPPPDARLTTYLNRLHTNFDKLRRLWERKHRLVRYNMVLNTMAQIRGWDLNTFAAIPVDERDAVVKALNDDTNKLLSELEPNDPLTLRLKEELKLTNEYFYNLLNQMNRPKEPEIGVQFDEKIVDLLKKLDEAYRKLNDRVMQSVPRSPDELERLTFEHKNFEDALQALDVDVSTVNELFRQIPNPTPSQRANFDHLSGRWEDLWELSRMYVERLKSLEAVLNGLAEVTDIVQEHEITLNSFDDMPAALDRLRGVHSQLLELNMVLQQQQNIIDTLNRNIALLRQHVSRTRQSPNHPDVDRLEDEVQTLTVRWENVCSQVADRLKTVEHALQTQMVYRTEYENEIKWLDNVEDTINRLRKPEELRPEQYQQQLDHLVAEYSQLQERTEAIENVNREGGKFIREAKGYDSRLIQYMDNIINIHGAVIRNKFRHSVPQPKNGAQQVAEELEQLNRRFAQLSSLILERRNVMQVLIQNWKRKKQEDLHNECVERQTKMSVILDTFATMNSTIAERFWLVASWDDASSAHNRMQEVRDELLSYGSVVQENIQEADCLCAEGAEIFTPDQFHSLKEYRNRLEITYNQLLQHTDVVLTRLNGLAKLLMEFSNETSLLHSFINEKTRELTIIKVESGDPQMLHKSQQKARLILDEAVSTEARLKTITILATHIQTEIDGYVAEMRVQYPNAQFPSIDAHELTGTTSRLQTDYDILLRGCHELSAYLSHLKSLATTYEQNAQNLNESIARLEEKILQAESSARSMDAMVDSTLMSQLLSELENLQHSSFEQTGRIETTIRSAAEFSNALLGTDAHDRIKHENQCQIDELARRQIRAQKRIEQNIDSWRSKLAKTEGIREGMANILSWLDEENKRQSEPMSLPLHVDKLIELRHQNELRQREISSRKRVLDELQMEAQKIAAANPDSAASRQILSDCSNAQKMFAALLATSKANGDNITELCTVLSSLNDLEKLLNENLLSLKEKLSLASVADINALCEFSNELKQLVENDWKKLESKYRWILAVPGVADSDYLNKSVTQIGNTIEKWTRRVDELIKHGQDVEEQRKEYDALKSKLVTNLEDIETKAQILEKNSLNPVELASQRSKCQLLQTEHQNLRAEVERLNDTGTKLIEVETIARMKMKGGTGQSEQAQTTLREMSFIQQRYNSLGSFLRSKGEKISTDSAKLSDWDLQRDSLARWINNEAKRLVADCPVVLDSEVVQTNIAKAERLEKVLVREKYPEIEEIRNKARFLMAEPSIPGTFDVANSQKALETNWENLSQAVLNFKKQNEAAKLLLEGKASLDKWLMQKERMMSAIGTVNVNPKVIDSQIIQIELLQSELEDQGATRNRVNELAHELVVNESTSLIGTNQVVKEMDALNRRWILFQDELKKKKTMLQKVKELSINFSNKQRDVKMLLLGVAEELEQISRSPLTSKTDVDEQLKNLDALSLRASETGAQMEELKQFVNEVCELTQDCNLQADIREQLNCTVQNIQELHKKIGSMKVAAVSAKDEEGQTLKEAEAAVKWIEDMQEQLSDLGSLSVLPLEIGDQRAAIEKIYCAVLDKEGDVTLLRAKLIDQMKKVPNPKQKATLDALSDAWNPLLKEVKAKRANAERAQDLLNELDTSLKSFTAQVDENRTYLEGLSANTNDLPAIAEVEQRINKQEVELATLETLLVKLHGLTTGPSLKKLSKEVENAAEDLRILLKDAKNITQKAQMVKDIQKRFIRTKEEAKDLLSTAKETAESLQGNDGLSVLPVTKEVLLKTVNDLESNWQKKDRELQAALRDIQGVVDRAESGRLDEEVREIGKEYAEVVAVIRGLHGNMEKKDEMLNAVRQKIGLLGAEVRKVNDTVLEPIGRSLSELEQQNKTCDELLKKIEAKEKVADMLVAEWQQISDNGSASMAQKNALMQQINELTGDLHKQRANITQRKRMIGNMQLAVQEFFCKADTLRDEFGKFANDETLSDPVKTELNDLRAKQEKLQAFREKLRPAIQDYVTVLESCDKLMKSADENISTESLEKEKSELIDAWNALNKQIADREQQICVSLQELGSYTDAHNALLIWLQDTEESLQNQRPPSIEYKVVKEQTRANDILLKHIEEKQQSIDGFKAMIDKVVELATDDAKREKLKEQAKCITERYTALLENAHTRRSYLHDAIILTEDWAQLSGPFKSWLDTTERTLQHLGQIPTDEEKLQQQMVAHQKLQENIDSKHPDVEKIVQLCPLLANFTSVEEAAELEATVKNFTVRYENLGLRAAECGVLLQQIAEDIATFLERTNTLTKWLDKIESDMSKLDTISVYPEELNEQSALLADLAMEVAKQETLVFTVVEDGHELCKQTTGDEAIALQSRIEALRARYLDLTAITDAKIAMLSEALPLSEKFHDGCEIVQQWMDAVEQDLHTIDQTPLEAQTTIIAQMEDDLEKWRPDVEEINGISKQLQNLCVGPKIDELEMQTDDMTRRFNQLAEQITRKADKLTSAEKQSRQVLDELDYLNEWFTDARDRLMQAAAPEVDPDYVKKQLKNQKQMNEDIAVMKARLRIAATDAQKVARALGDGASGQDSLLTNKIEAGRALSSDVTQMGEERLGELEQALALCLEIDHSFGELHSWLEKLENEIEHCPPVTTGHQRDQLMLQQAHNTKLQHSIISHKPLMDRFHKNVSALSELCGSDDEIQLHKVAEGLDERFAAARDAVRQRAEALETAMEQSSQFTDRLDVILANLDGAATQVRNPEPLSADLERIKSQILDNRALMEQLKHKEGILKSVKENAKEILMHAKPNDTAAAEISRKIKELDALWEEMMEGTVRRGTVLEDTLVKAERFWNELQLCQKAVEELRLRIEGIHPALGEPTIIEQQRNALMAIEGEVRDAKPEIMDKLRRAGCELCEVVAEEEKTHVEQQISAVEGGWLTVTNMCARKNSDLIEAMEKAMDFHGLLTELINWVNEAEAKVSQLDPVSNASSTDIKNELAALGDLRSLLDEKALEKEQLNQLGAGLCVGTTTQQSAIIRAPISDLNVRWNKLYVLLNERQQKLEKALLEMGQFAQAYEQLMIWIEKTLHVLNEINPRPTNIKEAEVEVCKLRVIQNDVLVHEASIDTLNSAAKRIVATDSNTAVSTQPMIDKLNTNWHMLVDKLEDIWMQLNDSRKAAENLGNEMDRWAMWLQDKDADLSHTKPTGGLPETAQAQLDDFFVLKAEIEQNRPALESHLKGAANYLLENVSDRESWITQRAVQIRKKWAQVQDKVGDREQKLRIALVEAEQLHYAMATMNDWLSAAEAHLGRLEHVSRIPDTLSKQMNEHATFQSEVSLNRELMNDLNSKGTKLQYYCEKKDAIPIKNLLVSAKHRFDKVVSRCADRMKQLDLAYQEARLYFESHKQLVDWVDVNAKWFEDQYVQTACGDRLRTDLEKHRKFQHDLVDRQTMYEATYKRGKALSEHAPRGEQAGIDLMNELLKQKWLQLVSAALQRQRSIEDALLACGQFDEALASLREWIEKALPSLQHVETVPVYGDLETVNKLSDEYHDLKCQIDSHRDTMNSVKERAQQMLDKGKDDFLDGLREKIEKLNNDWLLLENLAKERGERLNDARNDARDFDNQIHELLDWLPKIEARLRTKIQEAEGETEILEQMDEVAQLRKEMDDKEALMEAIKKAGNDIRGKCHPLAEQPMKYWLKVLQTRWDEVSNAVDTKRDDLEKQLGELRAREKMMADLMKYIGERSGELKVLNDATLPQDSVALNRLIDDHEQFEGALREKQGLVDEATKGRRKFVVEEQIKKKGGKTLQRHERSVRHPKSDQLSDRWKKLWIDSMDYGRRLREMKEYLEEMKRLESFSFEEWRERYLEWTDSGKARISDLFRRIDKSGTGRVPRSAFIDGIISSKFPTTRLEMEKVADVFDKGDGMIDAKEFMAKLRFDFSKKLPMKQKTDNEKITEEVTRQTERCNCTNRYKIQKVGEGHYRFGETQIKRMVRILRSTVMVRVGGGWVALEEFLHKHDPCRAKGRTNLDLQRNFYDDVRPKDAYDTIETFTKSTRTTPSRDSPIRGFQESVLQTRFPATPGPITKVREKTERSLPMHITRRTPPICRISPVDTPKSSRRPSDLNGLGHDLKLGRPNSSGTVSRSGSHGDIVDLARPVSRDSDVSADGDRPTRIPSLRGRKGISYRSSPARASPQPRT